MSFLFKGCVLLAPLRVQLFSLCLTVSVHLALLIHFTVHFWTIKTACLPVGPDSVPLTAGVILEVPVC